MSDGVIQIVVKPEDGRCEGCGEVLGDDFYETDDMVVLCKPCIEACKDEGTEEVNAELLEALKDLRTRYVAMFDDYVRSMYPENSEPDDDLRNSLVDTDAAIARAEGREAGK